MSCEFVGWCAFLSAEWLTVIGTWVVGIGAILIALAAHGHTVAATRRASEEQRQMVLRARTAIWSEMGRPMQATKVLEAISKRYRSSTRLPDAKKAIRRLRSESARLRQIRLDTSQLAVLDAKAVLLLKEFESTCYRVSDHLEETLVLAEEVIEVFDKDVLDTILESVDMAVTLVRKDYAAAIAQLDGKSTPDSSEPLSELVESSSPTTEPGDD